MAKYAPSGKVGPAGILLSVGFGLAAAAVCAVVFHFVGRFFYLILLFPLGWGLAVGAAAAAGVRAGKCRNAAVGLAAGAFAALASYGLFQALDNWHFRSAFKTAFAKEFPVDEVYDEFLSKEHGGTGFLAELSARADIGMNISRHGSGGKKDKPMISGSGMYVYWLIELAIIAGIGGLLSLAASREPFCESCEAWYQKSELAGIVPGKVEEVRRALGKKDFAAAAACAVRTHPGGALSLEKCPKCAEAPVVVKLELITQDKKGKEERSTVHEDLLAAADAQALEDAFGIRPAGAGPAAP